MTNLVVGLGVGILATALFTSHFWLPSAMEALCR